MQIIAFFALVLSVMNCRGAAMGAGASTSSDAAKPSYSHEKASLDRFFLTFSSDYPFEKPHLPKPIYETRLFIPVDSTATVGDHFFIVRRSSHPIQGVLLEIRSPRAEEFLTNETDYSVGVIRWQEPLKEDDLFMGRVLTYRGIALSTASVGDIREMKLNITNRVLKPGKHYVFEQWEIQLPLSQGRCVFRVENWWDSGQNLEADPPSGNTEGILSCHDKKEGAEIRETRLTHILSISDLDGDGIYEVLVHVETPDGEGRYEMRYFDGHKFLRTPTGEIQSRVLYTYMGD